MTQLLKKFQLLQFIIVMCFFILSSESNNEEILNQNTEYYIFLKNIIKYNNITQKYIETGCGKSESRLPHMIGLIPKFVKKIWKNNQRKSPPNSEKFASDKSPSVSHMVESDNKILLENNDYFYLFYNNHNVYTYFFKEKNSDDHIIYFNGLNSINDIKNILKTVFDFIKQDFNFKNIEKIINKKGTLYKFNENNIEIVSNDKNVTEVFDLLYNSGKANALDEVNKVHEKQVTRLKFKINGYSLGGPISQLFTLFILEKYENLNIEIYNIESWFGGNKDTYNELSKKVEISNIYSQQSVMYFFNSLCQKYFKSNYFIKNDEKNNEKNNEKTETNPNNFKNGLDTGIDYNTELFPIGIINYIVNNHLLSNIIS